MTLVLEDGTGVPNANSYVGVSEADSYFTDRVNEDWSDLSTSEKEIALIKAADYLQRKYRNRWVGTVATSTQRLYWPRSDAYGKDGLLKVGIPTELKEACYELAVRSATTTLYPDVAANSGSITKTSKKAGPVEVSYEYSTTAAVPVFNEIDGLLDNILGYSAGSYPARRV